MSVLSVHNLQETFVGTNISRTASPQVSNSSATGYIANGEIVVVNSSGVVYDASSMSYATSPWIQIVQRSGDQLVWSSKIEGNKLKSYRGVAAGQGQEQIYTVGYNGTTGSLDTTSGLDYRITLIENQDDMQWSEQKKKSVVNVPSSLITSQATLASAVVKNQMKKYLTDGSAITAVMLNNGTTTAFTGATTVSLTHGSTVLTPDAAITNAGFAAGSVLRLGVTGSTVATLTLPVYTVKEAHPTIANAWILDQPYAGPSNSALAVASAGVFTSVGANWGVRFVGKSLPFRRDFFKFKRVAFSLQMANFSTTILTKTQEASYGTGDGRLVLEEESACKGFEGALNRMSVPLPLANETFTAVGTTSTSLSTALGESFTTASVIYDAITIEYYSQNQSNTISGINVQPQIIKIFGYDAASQNTTANTGIQTALNDWMASTPSAFGTLSVM